MYDGFAVVNTTVVFVEKNIVLFKLEFYSNPFLNLFVFFNDNDYKSGLISIIRRMRKSV